MDAKALSAAAGIEVGTLNAWISRDYVPCVTPDAQGRRRDFDIDAATHVAIMAELSTFGFGAPLATTAAGNACDALKGHDFAGRLPFFLTGQGSHPIFLVIRTSRQRSGKVWVGAMQYGAFKSEEELVRALGEMSPSKRPSVYLTIDTGRIFKKMQQVEDEWQLRRKKSSGED